MVSTSHDKFSYNFSVVTNMLFWTGAMFLCASLAGVRGDCVKGFQEIGREPFYVVKKPGTWEEMSWACTSDFDTTHLIRLHTDLTAELGAQCRDVLVAMNIYKEHPYTWDYNVAELDPSEWQFYDPKYPRLKNGGGALNLTTNQWHLVKKDFVFSCAICHREPREALNGFHTNFESYEIGLIDPYEIKLVSREAHTGRAEISDDEKSSLIDEINVIIGRTLDEFNATGETVFRSSSINADDRLELVFHFNGNISVTWYDYFSMQKAMETEGKVYSTEKLQKYEMQITRIIGCPEEKTHGLDGREIIWKRADPGAIQSDLEDSTGVFTRRECTYNDTAYRRTWATPSYWKIEWKPCTPEEQYDNEVKYLDYLTADRLFEHIHFLHKYTSAPVDETTLKSIVKVVTVNINTLDDLDTVLLQDLNTILLNFSLINGTESYVLSTLYTQLVMVELERANPWDGVIFGYELRCNGKCPAEPINVRLTSKNNANSVMKDDEKFALQVSDEFISITTRLTFAVLWNKIDRISMVVLSDDEKPRYPTMNIAFRLNSDNTGWHFMDADYFYIEITYKQDEADESPLVYYETGCVAWNNDLNAWTAKGCKKLKAGRNNRTVCRCRGKYFVQKADKLTARFALMTTYSDDTHLVTSDISSHLGLAIAMGLELIMSGLSLILIILTAVIFKKWRENPGHKILMHMVFALVCNLVLGFATSLAQFDTEGDGCLAIGVLRHYTFLAMFLWMFVLSGLQLKRLTTVAGAITTSHLILKVAVFAWGVPLIPIVVLLAWNARFYRSDRFDRGYCYPEGLIFQLTVQAPAGLILLINFLIFIRILTHIFECTGEKKITKHSKNDLAEKLNRLKTSLFIFILFGFTWVFHFLSEERVINSDFLFEYMFLITTSFHITMLALFFIVFQESTRQLWLDYLDGMKVVMIVRKQVIRRTENTSLSTSTQSTKR